YRNLSKSLEENGIHHRRSCPYTHQQNFLAERKHRHIVALGLFMIAHSSMLIKIWDDAFTTAVYTINRNLFKHKPNYRNFRTFGCLCYPCTRPYNKHKLEYRSLPGVYLVYHNAHKGYKVLLPKGNVIVTRNIQFDESIFPFAQKMKGHSGCSDDYVLVTTPTLLYPLVQTEQTRQHPSLAKIQNQSSPNQHSTSQSTPNNSHSTHDTILLM
ncbi:Unknown protein, partial [Striga hermonthica]